MIIRQEEPNDYCEVYELIKEAFSTTEYSDGNEQNLAAALRKGTALIKEGHKIARQLGYEYSLVLGSEPSQTFCLLKA